jgi:large subunit ribosomal protein L17
MRHSRVINHLGRTSSHRKSMLSNMASSLILHKRITTTTAKAKALRTYVEPLITKSKEDSTHSRRTVFSYLKDKEAVAELFREVSPKIAERPGGYTRILKTGNRIGDNADMCIIELVDYNEAMLGGGETKTKSTRRRRSVKKKETAETPAEKAPRAEAKKEKPKAEKAQEEEKAPEE